MGEKSTSDLLGVKKLPVTFYGELAISGILYVNYQCAVIILIMCVRIYEIGYMNLCHDEISQIWDFLEYRICDNFTISENF